ARRGRGRAGGRRNRRRLRPGGRARGMPAQARGRGGGDRPGGVRTTVILLVDNYDSFTHNLAHLFGELGVDVVVRRNDVPDLERLQPERLPRSPGPRRPPERRVSLVPRGPRPAPGR